jgi:AraC-like DNA-binding protein
MDVSTRTDSVSHPVGPRVHVMALRGMLEVLDSLGEPVEPLLTPFRLVRADFDDPDRTAPYGELDDLFGACIQATSCQHFGLRVGERTNLRSFGVLGRLVANADTVGQALNDLSLYFLMHDSGGAPMAAIHDGSVTFSYGIQAAGVRNSQQIYDLAAAAMTNIMRDLCGRDWRPDAILLPRRRPRDIGPYRAFFDAPLRFESLQAGIIFPSPWLQRPVKGADPLLHRILMHEAGAQMLEADPLLLGDVRRVIRRLFAEGDCSRARVADGLGMHERTLGRRLKAAGTTFQAVLDDTRSTMARQLLRDTRIPVAKIASALGYGDPTVFSRAFRRWTRLTPRDFRESLGRAG